MKIKKLIKLLKKLENKDEEIFIQTRSTNYEDRQHKFKQYNIEDIEVDCDGSALINVTYYGTTVEDY